MAYFIMTDLIGIIPEKFVNEALDDDEDGSADVAVFDALQADAERQVHSFVANRYTTPFEAPVPPVIAEAALVFAAEQCYTRRGKEAPAGLADRAAKLRAKLTAIGKGDEALSPTIDRTPPSASAITETSRLGSNLTV